MTSRWSLVGFLEFCRVDKPLQTQCLGLELGVLVPKKTKTNFSFKHRTKIKSPDIFFTYSESVAIKGQ